MQYEWFPMQDLLSEELRWWYEHRPVKNSPYVFVSTWPPHFGKPFTARQRFMRGLCKRAGVKPFGFQALRRYFGSVLADEYKQSPKTIQRLLRHSNLATTERYLKNLNRDLKSVLEMVADSVSKGHTEGTHKEEGVNPDDS
jgi:integrase